MLTDDTKNQIRAEEIFRNEVQKELNGAKNKQSKLWEFLNSSFGIWLLSSVALGLITWGYSQISATIADKNKNRTEIAKRDAELGARIKAYKNQLSKVRSPFEYYQSNGCFIRGECYDGGYALLEFKNSSNRQLLIELATLTSSDRKLSIQTAISGLDSLSRVEILAPPAVTRGELHEPINDILTSNAKKLTMIINTFFDDQHWK